jgi:predicted enzyme related to lactoylglutathione lyase
VDLTASDVGAAANFYGQLFGWQSDDLGEQAGHYTMFRSNGKLVAAVSPPMTPNSPPAWSTYIATADAAETARKIAAAGGKELVAPFAVMEAGTMGVFADPTGAVFSIWEPGQHKGAELVNVPVSLSWNELATRDMNAAKAFYAQVFGWAPKANPMPDGSEYVEWQIDGRSVGGGMSMGSMYPPEVPAHWLVYFAVQNTDDIVKRAEQAGGRVIAPPMDIPQGRFAIVSDPQGAAFAVIALAG